MLAQLSNAIGVSSAEDEIRKLVYQAARPFADEAEVDTMGNLFFTRRARLPTDQPVQRVMITAHLDEVGFMITDIKENGRLKFQTVGGFNCKVLLGKQVLVGPERVLGVIGLTPIHLLNGSQRRSAPEIKQMEIDIGATSKGNAKAKVGDFATFATQFARLGPPSPYPPKGRGNELPPHWGGLRRG